MTVPSVTTNTTVTLTNISDGSCSSAINLTATTVVNALITPTFNTLGPYCQTGLVDPLLTTSMRVILEFGRRQQLITLPQEQVLTHLPQILDNVHQTRLWM